jgi:hypothetical protein
MSVDTEWPTRLKAAAEALERSPGAPDWLACAVRDAVAVAGELAPISPAAPEPHDFIYPH